MKKIVKTLEDFENHKFESMSKVFGGGSDDPTEGDGKNKPKIPPPPKGPLGPVIIIIREGQDTTS
tara:strand:- start:4114 stop:4308 length:195 start_codon:yes stop_codon:yes gene_type:complete